MTMKITLNLDETVYERAKPLAQQQRQDVAKALARWLEETLPEAESSTMPTSGDRIDRADEDAAMEREMQAYIALHPQLLQAYRHQFVAIHGGRLVDHDVDFEALFRRVAAAYRDEFVWLTEVEDKPIRELVFRSPRFARK